MTYLTGYEGLFPDDVELGSRLWDGYELLSVKGFWPAYFLAQHIEDEDLVLEAFGCPAEVSEGAYEALADETSWPVFDVALPGGPGISVVFRNFPEDRGVDYVLAASETSESKRLAAVEGDFSGPALSWPELDGLVALAPDGIERAQRLLLLAPAYADGAFVDRATEAFSRALVSVGASHEHVQPLAEALADGGGFWGWTAWAADAQGVWGCDGEYSPRNRNGSYALDPATLSQVSEILGAIRVEE